MKNILYYLLLIAFLSPLLLQAQIENVIVETYYISDANDATNTIGGGLEVGSKTYRIYVDLIPGSKLKKIYGDANHALKISSTANFFNNTVDGQSFARDFNKNRFGENTVALDSWLTLGQVTKTASKTYFGILKDEDTDGSIIGGTNNDGGSGNISTGLLASTNPDAGKPLTLVDGLDTMFAIPSNWANYGFVDVLSGIDSTILGSTKVGAKFISHNAGLQNSGVMGVIPESNLVLVAQLTTKGEISFELNVEVLDTNGKSIKYVAHDSILVAGEVLNRYLKYPFVKICGCPEPDYFEYIADRDCDKMDSCKTLIVLGCMDPMACNFDASANFNVQDLCCYPGNCNDRDISLVCTQLSVNELTNAAGFYLFPNPVQNQLEIQISSPNKEAMKYEIFDSFGRLVLEKNIVFVPGNLNPQVDVSNIAEGLYLFRLFMDRTSTTKMFIKN